MFRRRLSRLRDTVADLSGRGRAVPDLRRRSAHLPAAVALLAGLAAVLSVVDPALPAGFQRVEHDPLLSVPALSRSYVAVSGFFLVFVALNLWRRKRTAWWVAVVLLAASVPAHMLKGHDRSMGVLAALSLVLLLAHRRRFVVRSDIPSMRQGMVRFVLSLGFALAYGTIGLYLVSRREVGAGFRLVDALGQALREFMTFSSSGLVPHARYESWFLESIAVMGVAAIAYATYSLTRPVIWRYVTLDADRRRARQLIEAYGRSGLDAFKWSDDKVFFFSSSGRAVISYGLGHGTAIALGDPAAADDGALRDVVAEFLQFADVNGWRVAFHQVPPTHLEVYRAAGLAVLKIGETAVVDLDSFSLDGADMRTFRRAVHHFKGAGYRAELLSPPQSDVRLSQMRSVSEEWLSLVGRRERRFTVGAWDDDYIRGSPVMVVEAPDGRCVAFVNLVHDGVPGEATADLMRRRAEPNGVMDFLFAELFVRMKAGGYHGFCLGLSPLADVGIQPGSRRAEQALHQLYEHLNRVFSYKGLHEYKEKFHPTWEPAYLVYQREASLPIIALALAQLTE